MLTEDAIVCACARPELAARFWAKVDKSGECWAWTAYRLGNGYGRFCIGNRRIEYAHRVSWVLAYGPIPAGLYVCHKCDVRECVRPDHLFLGTPLDNVRDCAEKGRANHARGERAYTSKLTADQVREIRALGGTKLQREIAAIYGVDKSAISEILSRKAWAHV